MLLVDLQVVHLEVATECSYGVGALGVVLAIQLVCDYVQVTPQCLRFRLLPRLGLLFATALFAQSLQRVAWPSKLRLLLWKLERS